MYSIVASDLDGTLLNPSHQISPFTKETIQTITNKGINFIFTTGRHHLDVSQMSRRMGINSYMITSNGSRVHSPDNKLVLSYNIPAEIVSALITEFPFNPNVYTNLYHDNEWLVDRPHPGAEAFFAESHFPFTLFNPRSVNLNGIAKVFFTADRFEYLEPYEQQLKNKFGSEVNIAFSSSTCLEVMPLGISKGYSLQKTLELLDSSMNDCIAFGDGMNDVEMLSMVGKGCIMGNALTPLKKALPHLEVIGRNSDDAVANYLKKLYLSDQIR